MGHELVQRSGQPLTVVEVQHRLAKEFGVVRVDAAEGTRHALARADWIERAPAKLFLGHHAEALAFAARLRQLAPGDAAAIEFGDEPGGAFLRLLVVPGEPLTIGYASDEAQGSSAGLVQRCAAAWTASSWSSDCWIES